VEDARHVRCIARVVKTVSDNPRRSSCCSLIVGNAEFQQTFLIHLIKQIVDEAISKLELNLVFLGRYILG
jgi:hypothetical protein